MEKTQVQISLTIMIKWKHSKSSSLQGYRFDPIYGTCNDINIENTNTNKNNSYNINNININNSDNQHNIDIFSNVKYKKKWMII